MAAVHAQDLLTAYEPTFVSMESQSFPLELESKASPFAVLEAEPLATGGADTYYEDFTEGLKKFVESQGGAAKASPGILEAVVEMPSGGDGILDFAEPAADEATGDGLPSASPKEGSSAETEPEWDDQDADFEFVGRGEMDETEKETEPLQEDDEPLQEDDEPLQEEPNEESPSILDSVVSNGAEAAST